MSIKGPCVLCGATNYQLSYGGLTICPSCDCGIPPEVRELRDENAKLQNALSDFTLLMAVNKDLEAKLSLAEKALENIVIILGNPPNPPCCIGAEEEMNMASQTAKDALSQIRGKRC